MPRVELANGGYVDMNDAGMSDRIILEVGHPEFGCTSVEIADLDELDRVVALVASNEGDEEAPVD